MKSVTKLCRCQFGLVYVATIGFIYHNTVRHLHDTTFDALKFVTRAGQLNQQKEIHHRVYSRFTLPYAYCFYKDLIETGRLTQNNRFTGFTGYPSQRTGRGAWTNKRIGMYRQLLHTGFIT